MSHTNLFRPVVVEDANEQIAARAFSSRVASAQAAASASLVNFTESVNTAVPNDTIPVVRLLATNVAANVDIALSPKGTGANAAQVSDNTTTGGNKRGNRATDWQKIRSSATSVASGTESTIGGGTNNTASGAESTVAGGSANNASGQFSSMGGGANNAASSNYATVAGGSANTASTGSATTVGGGDTNTATGAAATVPGGTQNTASGDYSVAIGQNAITRGLQGAFAHSASKFSSDGDRQVVRYVQRRSTTDATTIATSANGSAPAAATAIVLPNNSAYAFRARVVARNNANGDAAGFEIAGVIKRGANAASTALVGTPTSTSLGADTGALTWTAVAAADTTLGSLAINVTGAAATTVGWAVGVDTVECVV